MIVGLMGFECESPNKGCEALSYSLVYFLQSYINEDLEIYNFSNLGMGYIETEFPAIKFKHTKLKIKDPTFKMIKAFYKCDLIFDVTMGDSFSDIYSKQLCLNDMKFKKLAQIFNKKYVLMPQTYGPFTDKTVRKQAGKILKRAYCVLCRDELSQHYIANEFGIYKSILATDMAFMLPYDKKKFQFDASSNLRIGLNVSGMLWKGGFDKTNQFGLKCDYQKYVEAIIQCCLDNKYEVHLIPHVIDTRENARDDDYFACELLKSKYLHTILAPAFRTPMEAKSYIANMDCFIGARMHSTIGAFSAMVPTIPFSYSRKFEGLFDSLDYPYVVHGTQDNIEVCLKKTFEFIDNVDLLKETVQQRMQLIENKINTFFQSMQELLKTDK